MAKKYYHASPVRFKPGDALVPNLPNWKPNFNFSCSGFIYLTESPEPHYTVYDVAVRENWTIYEVLPYKPKSVKYSSCWDEWITYMPCEVIRVIGSARGISKAGRKSKTKRQKSYEEWLKERINEAKQAEKAGMNSEEYKEFVEFYEITPKEYIKRKQNELMYKNGKTSKALVKRNCR